MGVGVYFLMCCAVRRSTADTKPYPTEFGIASWYGPGFHGRQTASGVVYDQNLMVAAHKTLPFGTVARVTNLENGLQVEVCIVDRGPYVKGRVRPLLQCG